jgi:3-oxoacyl-(acyl-carrier-protein) synthase
MLPLAVTGVGLVSPLGIGFDAFRRSLAQPEQASAFRDASSVLGPDKIPQPTTAEVWNFDPTPYLGDKGLRNFDRLTKFMLVSAKLALEDAGLKRQDEHIVFAPERVGVCSATAYGSLDAINELVTVTELEDPRFVNPNRFPNTVINSAAGYVSIREDLRAANVTIVDGNCGGLDVVLASETHLRNQRADAFLVGGGEALSEPLYLAFRKLSTLAEVGAAFAPGRPDSQGMRLGEGAVYLCVEHAAAARERGARSYGELLGYGNAFEPPDSNAVIVHASERAVERAIAMALGDAALGPADIDLVCASFNGMVQFDAAELAAIDRVLGPHMPLLAPKTWIGETFGASGALATAATLAWLTGTPFRPLRGELASPPRTVLILAVGFYGNVSALVARRAE